MPSRFIALNNAGSQHIFEVSASATADQTIFRDNSGNTLLLIDSGASTVSFVSSWTSSAPLHITNTTTSTSSTTGALIVDGGVGIAGNTFTTGTVTFANTTQATAIGTASVVLDGGLSVAKQSYFGDLVHLLNGLDLGSTTINNVANPVGAYDAANKSYVDAVAAGLSPKASVTVATTGPLTISTQVVSGAIIDGVTLAYGNRVLVKDQTDATQNGIYVVATTGAPSRANDFASGTDVSGDYVFVENGTTNADSGWVVHGSPNVIGTNTISWTQFSGLGEVTAGNGLSKTGNRLDVVTDTTTIEIYNNALRIAGSAAGTGLTGGGGSPLSVSANLNFVTGLGTITTGTWQASAISVPYGGTGASTFTNGAILVGNGTAPVQVYSGLTWDSSNNVLAVNGVKVSSKLDITSTSVSAALDLTGQFFGVHDTTFIDTSTPATSATSLWYAAFIGRNTYSAFNSGVVVTDAASLYLRPPTAGNNATFTRVWSMYVGDGNVGIGTTTASTSATTGALVVTGGVGISGNIFVAQNLNSVGTSGGKVILNNTTSDNGIVQGPDANNAIYFKHNYAAVDQRLALYAQSAVELYTGGLINAQVLRLSVSASGVVSISNTATSTSASTGALVVTGGIGVGGASSFGASVSVLATTASTSAATGALVVSGGTGMSGDLYTGGNIHFSGPLGVVGPNATGSMISMGTPFTSGTFAGAAMYGLMLQGTTLVCNVPSTASGTLFKVSTFNADSSLASDLVTVDASTVTITSTTNATTSGAGALVLAGGMYVPKDVAIGGSAFVNTNLALYNGTNAYNVTVGMSSGTLSINNPTGGITLNAGAGNIVFSASGTTQFGAIATDRLVTGSNFTGAATAGQYLSVGAYTTTLTSNTTSYSAVNIQSSTVAGSTTGTTITNASSMLISGPPLVGANATITDSWAMRVEDGRVYIGSTVDATSNTSSASLMLAGGLSVAKTIYASIINANASDTSSNRLGNVLFARMTPSGGGLVNVIQSGTTDWTTFSDLYIAAPNSSAPLVAFHANQLQVYYTQDASSASTGALVVSGGLGLSKTLWAAGNVSIMPTATYYNTNPVLTIGNGTTWQNLGTGALVVCVFEQAGATTTLPDFSGRQILQSTTVSINYTSPSWPLNDGTTALVTAPFGARFIGYVKPLYAEAYTIYVTVQGAARVFINGQTVVNSWIQNANATVYNGTFTFSNASSWTPIIVEWATSSSPCQLLLEWSSASQPRQTIPASAFAFSAHQASAAFVGTVNVQGPATFSSPVTVTNTISSTSTSTGALVVDGGIGVQGNINVGGNVTQGNMQVSYGGSSLPYTLFTGTGTQTVVGLVPPAGTTNTTLIRLWSTINTANPVNTSFIDIGWDGVSTYQLWSRINAAGTVYPISIGIDQSGLGKFVSAVDGTFSITTTVDSSSATTGSLIVSGGVGIGKSVTVGGSVTATTGLVCLSDTFTLGSGETTNGNTGLSRALVKDAGGVLAINYSGDFFGGVRIDSPVHIPNTTASTSVSTGALIVGGGVGVAGTASIGGGVLLTDGRIALGTALPTGGTDLGLYSSSTAGSRVRFVTNAGTFAWYLDSGYGTTTSMTLDTTGVSLVLPMQITNTTDATSVSAGGAMTVSGGLAVFKSAFIGGNLSVSGTFSPSSVSISSTTNATSASSGGAFTSAGGGSFGKDLWIGGTVFPNALVSFQGTSPLLSFGASGIGAPTMTTRSVGTKVLLYNNLSTTAVDTAIGVHASSKGIWFSVPTSTSDALFTWYGGVTNVMQLDGTGGLVLTGQNTHVDILGTNGTGGSIRVAPNSSGYESSIAFYKDSTLATSTAGDAWEMGRAAFGTSGFALGTNVYGAVMTFTSTGQASLTCTIDATSSSAGGALTVAGGTAIGKSLYVGGAINATGHVILANNTSLQWVNSSGTAVDVMDVSLSNQVSIFGAGGTDMYVNPSGGTTNLWLNKNTTGTVYVNNGATTMCTIDASGVNVTSGNLNVSSTGVVNITNTVQATSASAQNGALNVAGGVAVGGKLFCGNEIVTSYTGSGVAQLMVSGATTSVYTTLAMNSTNDLLIDNNSGSIQVHGSSGVTMTNTSDSSSFTSGALVLSGGAGIGKGLFVGGRAVFCDTSSLGARFQVGTISNVSGTSPLWWYLGQINTTTGANGTTETGAVHLGLFSSGAAACHLELLARTASGNITAEHAWHSNWYDVSGTNTNISQLSIYIDTSGNYHLFASVGVGCTVNVVGYHQNQTSAWALASEGNGTVPNGSTSGFSSWTLSYSTAKSSTNVVRLGELYIDNTTDATSSSGGGAITVAGGLSVAKTSYLANIVTGTVNTAASTTSLVLQSGGVTKMSLSGSGTNGIVLSDSISLAAASTYDLGSSSNPWRNVYIGGSMSMTSTTASTSTSTGALVISGGLGVGGNVTAGGQVSSGNLYLLDSYKGSTVNSSYATIGRTGGGTLFINVPMEVGSALSIDGTASGTPSNTTGISMTIAPTTWQDTTTAASSTASGSVYGTFIGAPTLTALNTSVTTGIASTLYVSNAPTASTNQTITNSWALYVNDGRSWFGNTTDATSSVNGAIVVSGGLSVGKSVWANKFSLPAATAGDVCELYTAVSGSQTTMIFHVGNDDASGDHDGFAFVQTSTTAGGDKTVLSIMRSSITCNAVVSITDTTASTSTTTGSLVVSGGVGISGSVYIGDTLTGSGQLVNGGSTFVLGSLDSTNGTSGASRALYKASGNVLAINYYSDFTGGVSVGSVLHVTDTTNTTSSSTGALVVNGGMAVSKNVGVYGTLAVDLTGSVGVVAAGATVAVNTASWNIDTDVGNTNRIVSLVSNASGGGVTLSMRNTLASTFWDVTTEAGGLGRFALTSVPQAGGSGTSWFTVSSTDGGVSVRSTSDASSVNSGGALTLSGGLGVAKTAYFGSNTYVVNSVSGGMTLSVQNTSNSSTSWSQLVLRNDTNNIASIFYNSSARTSDGNASALTLRNDGGDLRLLSSGGNGLVITATTGGASFSSTVGILSTTDSTSLTSAAMVVSGGASIGKSIRVGGPLVLYGSSSGTTSLASPATGSNATFTLPLNLPPYANASLIAALDGTLSWGAPAAPAGSPSGTVYQTFNAANNVTTPTNINGLTFSGGIFSLMIKVDVSASTGGGSASYRLDGVYKSSTWDMVVNYFGDDLGIQFSITNSGQVQYTSPNFSGWTSTVFSWDKSITASNVINVLSVGDNLYTSIDPTKGAFLDIKTGLTFTDDTTAAGGTVSAWYGSRFGTTTLDANNTSVTTSDAATVYIEGAPITGTQETISSAWALQIGSGKVQIADTTNASGTSTGALQIAGGISINGNAFVGGNVTASSLTVGNGTLANVIHGSVVIGASGSASIQVTVTFGTTLSTTAYRLLGTVNTTTVAGTVFAIAFSGLTTTGATANILRVDTNSGWTDTNVRLDWTLVL